MPISTILNTKIRLKMLCLSGFELYSRWVPLLTAYCGGESIHILISGSKSTRSPPPQIVVGSCHFFNF